MDLEIIMFVPCVLLVFQQNDTVLLLKRGNVSFGSGLYCLPGGKIDGNETARQAAIREAYEELVVTIDEQQLQFVHLFHRKGASEEVFAIIFLVKAWQGEFINREPEKHEELQWVHFDVLPENIIPAQKQGIELIQNQIFYSEHGWKL